MARTRVDILMYHAIDEAGGATSVPPARFAAQMSAVAASGLPVIAMDAVRAHIAGDRGPALAITFDDGFQDFADVAWPVLQRHAFPAMVYLPAAHIGGHETWHGGNADGRRLMDWSTVRALAGQGAHFGNHTSTHADLTRLEPAKLASELDMANLRLADELGEVPRHAAPPYGRSNAQVRRALAQRFDTGVGTELGSAAAGADPHDLPRLEMFYFANMARWRDQLAGRGGPYLALRKAARGLRRWRG